MLECLMEFFHDGFMVIGGLLSNLSKEHLPMPDYLKHRSQLMLGKQCDVE